MFGNCNALDRWLFGGNRFGESVVSVEDAPIVGDQNWMGEDGASDASQVFSVFGGVIEDVEGCEVFAVWGFPHGHGEDAGKVFGVARFDWELFELGENCEEVCRVKFVVKDDVTDFLCHGCLLFTRV